MADIMRKAEKLLQSSGGLFSSFFGGKTEKAEEAVELFVKAANTYRIQDQMKEAAQAYERAAEVYETHLDDPASGSYNNLEAFKSYKMVPDIPNAARCLEKVIQYNASERGLGQAANHQKALAELYLEGSNPGDFPNNPNYHKAITALRTAGKWLRVDNKELQARSTLQRAADVAAFAGDYDTAFELYEDVADSILRASEATSRLMLPKVFLKALITLYAKGDHIAIGKATGRFCEADPSFQHSFDFRTYLRLTSVMEGGDFGEFDHFINENSRDDFLQKMATRLRLLLEQEEDLS